MAGVIVAKYDDQFARLSHNAPHMVDIKAIEISLARSCVYWPSSMSVMTSSLDAKGAS